MQTIDFNSYVGNYNFTLNPTQYTFLNSPITLNNIFTFTAEGSYEDNSMLQTITIADSPAVYTRQWVNGTFGTWQS